MEIPPPQDESPEGPVNLDRELPFRVPLSRILHDPFLNPDKE